MSPSTRKKVLIGAGGVIGVLIVALLIAPSFFDPNQYNPQIVAEVKKATGRDLVIDGPLSLSLLPLPEVSVTGVKFFNVPGAKNPNMVEVKSVTVRPSLLALLGGGLEVSEVTLVEPKIVLEVNAEGKPNWEFTPSVAEVKPAAPKPASPKPMSLGRLTIENGTLIFSDSKAGVSVVAEKANFSASVGSLDGPYGLEGDSGSGSLSVTLKPALVVDGKLVLPRIDLDHALAALQQPPTPTAAGAKPAASAGTPAATPAGSSGDSMLTSLTAKLSIEA